MADSTVTVPLYRGADGVFFLVPYRGATARMRGEATDPESSRVLNFKTWRKGSGYFAAAVEAVRSHLGCEAVVAVPPSSAGTNAVQALVDDEAPVVLRPVHARPNRHNAKTPLDIEAETTRVSVEWRAPAKRIGKVLLLDDIARSGETITLYAKMLKARGIAREVVPFALGAVTTSRRFKKVSDITFNPWPDIAGMEGEAPGTAGSGAGASGNLERLRGIRADIAAMELQRMRGELLERGRIHSAFGEVVAIVRAGLLGLPRWGAVNLANLPGEKIETLVDAHVRALADDFQKRCGEVKLTAPVAATKDTKAMHAKGRSKAKGRR